MSTKKDNKKKSNLPISNVKYSTYSRDEYIGYSDAFLKQLEQEKGELNARLQMIEKMKETKQLQCIHIYKFVCRGMHEDTYQCEKCGHITEK